MAFNKGEVTPENQYHLAHNAFATSEGIDNDDASTGNFTAMMNKALLFANIPEAKLPYHEKQIACLTHMLDMAKRDKEFIPTFMLLYYRWYNKLNITKAVKGKAMDDLVSMAIGRQGGGPQYAINPLQQQLEKDQRSFFDALMGKKPPQQQQPMQR